MGGWSPPPGVGGCPQACFVPLLKHQRQHLELAQSLGNDTEQQRAWATIGRTYMFMAEAPAEATAAPAVLREAERAFRTSLTIVEEKLEGVGEPGEPGGSWGGWCRRGFGSTGVFWQERCRGGS